MQLEEERRKENARRKLLELEERIAKREAEKKQQEEARFVLVRLGVHFLVKLRTLFLLQNYSQQIVLHRSCVVSMLAMYQIDNFPPPRSIQEGIESEPCICHDLPNDGLKN